MEMWRTTKTRNRSLPRTAGSGRWAAPWSRVNRRRRPSSWVTPCRRSSASVWPRRVPARFERYLRTLVGVLGAWRVTGDVDYELLIACRAIADLDGVLTCLRGCGGTEVASAELVLREVDGPRAARPALAAVAGNGRSDVGH